MLNEPVAGGEAPRGAQQDPLSQEVANRSRCSRTGKGPFSLALEPSYIE